jgi:hypothetical protein
MGGMGGARQASVLLPCQRAPEAVGLWNQSPPPLSGSGCPVFASAPHGPRKAERNAPVAAGETPTGINQGRLLVTASAGPVCLRSFPITLPIRLGPFGKHQERRSSSTSRKASPRRSRTSTGCAKDCTSGRDKFMMLSSEPDAFIAGGHHNMWVSRVSFWAHTSAAWPSRELKTGCFRRRHDVKCGGRSGTDI